MRVQSIAGSNIPTLHQLEERFYKLYEGCNFLLDNDFILPEEMQLSKNERIKLKNILWLASHSAVWTQNVKYRAE